jgi:hypothetical protein
MDTIEKPARQRARRPSAAQVTRFTEDGYVVLKGLVPNREEFNSAIEAVARENASKPVFMRYEKHLSLDELGFTYETFAATSYSLRIPEIHALSPRLRELIAGLALDEYLAAFLPGESRLAMLQSLYFPFSSNQASHSDKFLVSPPEAPYRRETLIGVWLALDGTDRTNGPLFGWSRSQRVPGKPLLANYKQYGHYARDLGICMINAGLQPHFIYADPGDVVLWASDFVHGGSRALDPLRTRRSLVLHYGARVAP